jgi:transposase
MSPYPHHYHPHLTTPLPWRPLADDEVQALAPYFIHQGSGRPMFDIRARLDAIFWAVTHNGPWKDLPAAFGPADTASRQFRRWAHKGVWSQLLKHAAMPGAPPILRRLEHWLCRAFRRALRILKLPGIVLARRLGMESALNAPAFMLPDPDLSETLLPLMRRMALAAIGRPFGTIRAVCDALKSCHHLIGGRRRIPKYLAPP